MKFTHYDYKCHYYVPSEDPIKKHELRIFTASNRSEINLDLEYHASSICIYTDDKEIEKFCLGVDFSPPGSTLVDRCQDRLFLNFIVRGKGRINGKPFSAGQFYYTLPLETHTIETDVQDPFVSAWISVEGTYTQRIISELNKIGSSKSLLLYHRSDIMKMTKFFLYEMNLGETSVATLKSLIDLYISYINPNTASALPEIFPTKKTEQLIRESKIYVRKNLKHVTVADMAADQHYNTKYFSRVFTEAMGITPLEYINNCKMEWAKNSLIHSTLSISEIMNAIGYDHRNGFTIAFKKKFGYTPAAYRKKMKNCDSASNS